MVHEPRPPTSDDDCASRGLLDVNLLAVAALLASDDGALGAAVRRVAAGLGDSTPAFAAFGNFAPESPDPL